MVAFAVWVLEIVCNLLSEHQFWPLRAVNGYEHLALEERNPCAVNLAGLLRSGARHRQSFPIFEGIGRRKPQNCRENVDFLVHGSSVKVVGT